MPTLPQMVEQVRGHLDQYTTNRPVRATFTGWQGTAPNYTGINLAGVSNATSVTDALVQIGHELVYVSVHDPVAGTKACPPWFRGQQGSPAADAQPPNTVAVIDPQWPYHHVATHLVSGMANLYPSLFVVRTTELLTDTFTQRYPLPADVGEIVKIRIEDDSDPRRPEREVWRWSFDTKGPTGPTLYMPDMWRAGMPVHITYRAAPVLPEITDTTDFTATGLPATAADLPVLWAVAVLLPSADAAKTQLTSVEQSERNRFVQSGSATAASRRFHELYRTRLEEERRKLVDLYPPRLHRSFN